MVNYRECKVERDRVIKDSVEIPRQEFNALVAENRRLRTRVRNMRRNLRDLNKKEVYRAESTERWLNARTISNLQTKNEELQDDNNRVFWTFIVILGMIVCSWL